MGQRMKDWFTQLPFETPVERRQALLLQIFLVLIVLGPMVWLLLPFFLLDATNNRFTALVAGILCALGALLGIFLLRRGTMVLAARIAALGYVCGVGLFFLNFGFVSNQSIYGVMFIPLILAALFLSLLDLILVISTLFAILVASTTFKYGSAQYPEPFLPVAAIGTLFLVGFAVGIFLSFFGHFLRTALVRVRTREQELEQIRGNLEQVVAQRTLDLQDALQKVQVQFAIQKDLLAENAQQRELIQILSVPVLPISHDILVMPLIGLIDAERSAPIMESLLSAVDRHQAQFVLIDMTGVPLVDQEVAHILIKAARATKMLGTRTILVGLRPELAQTLVSLGLDLATITTKATLKDGVSYALKNKEHTS